MPVREAFAQDDPSITAEARKRFLEGVKLFDEKKFEQARVAFVQAYALKKHPDVLLNLANTEVLSNRHFDAVGHFKEFLRDPGTSAHPKRGDAERGLAEARQKTGRIQVTVDVADAEVFVAGKKIGTSPLSEPIDVPAGTHPVEARKGDKKDTQSINAGEGKVTIAALNLGGGGVAPVPPPGEPKKDEPKKDEPKKDEPKKDEPKDPGASATEGGGREPFMTWATRSPVAYVGAGLFVVGAGMGLVFMIQGNSAKSNAESLTAKVKDNVAKSTDLSPAERAAPCAAPVNARYVTPCADLRSNLDAQDSDRTLSTVGFIGAVVGAGVVVGGYFLTAKKGGGEAASAPAPRFMLAPVIGPQMNGLGAVGSF